MTKKIFLVLIIALIIAMLIVPTSAAKPTINPTPTPTPTQKPDPNNAIWDAIHDLQTQVAGLLSRVVDLETNKVSMDDFNALKGRVATLETANAALAARVTKLEAGDSCTPSSEVCDGMDNDCDDLTDEGSSLCGDGACVDGVCTTELTCPLMLTCMYDCENNQLCEMECYMSGSSSTRSLVDALNVCMTQNCNSSPDPGSCVTDYCSDQYQACLNDGGGAGWNLGQSCSSGVGACESEGKYVWNSDETATVCNAVPGTPVAEICDSIDNDCDGQTDGALADVACDAIGDGLICLDGVCSTSSSGCGDGVCNDNENANDCPEDCGLPCEETNGGVEICDGLDNDCNPATVDGSGDSRVGVSCDGLDADLCDEGVTICSAGRVSCDDATDDILEVCNTFDDDCDGAFDEGTLCLFDNAGGVCTSGVCQMGNCDTGYKNCDMNPNNGCEVDVTNDPANCGACFNVCDSEHPCSNGSCV